jgi:anti-anti-sigma regulatory factor
MRSGDRLRRQAGHDGLAGDAGLDGSSPRTRPVADLAVLQPGAHLCAVCSDAEELGRVAAVFVGIGLAAGDQVLYVAGGREPAAVRARLEASGVPATEALDSGQLAVHDFGDLYGAPDRVDLDQIACGLRAAASRSSAGGFPGLRVAAEMADFARAVGSMEQLLRWERMLSRLQQEEGIITVCQYDRRRLASGEAALIAGEHGGSAPDSAPAPRASFLATRPWGLRVTGEVDVCNRAGLIRALRARASARAQVCLDLAGLTFADVGTLRAIYQTAAALPADGSIFLANPPRQVQRVLDLAELRHSRVTVRQP